MLRARDPNQLPAPAVKIPLLGSSNSGKVAGELRTAANGNTTTGGGSPSSATKPPSVAAPALTFGTPGGGSGQPKPAAATTTMMTFRRVGLGMALATGAPSPLSTSDRSHRSSDLHSPQQQKLTGRHELRVFECDPEPEPSPQPDAAQTRQQPSFSLRKAATGPVNPATAYTVAEEPRSPSPEPLAPLLGAQQQQHRGEEAEGAKGTTGPADLRPSTVAVDSDNDGDDDSVSAIASTERRARSLEREFVPDHLLNNEDFIERLVSEVRGSLPFLDGAEGERESDGEGYADAEVQACLRTGRQPRQQQQRCRSVSPARSRSPSPCVEAVVLSAPATVTSWQPEHKHQPAIQQQQRSPRLSVPARPMRLGPNATAASKAPGGKGLATTNPVAVVEYCDDEAPHGDEGVPGTPSSIAAAVLSRASSPEPRELSPGFFLPRDAAEVMGSSPSPCEFGNNTRSRRAAAVSPDRGAPPEKATSSREQQQQRGGRSVSPAPSSGSLGGSHRRHPTWAPRPVQQRRPAWGQRVPPSDTMGKAAAGYSPGSARAAADARSRSVSPSPRAPALAAEKQPQRRSGDGSRSRTMTARPTPDTAKEAGEGQEKKSDAVATDVPATAAAAAAASGAGKEASSNSPSPQQPYARVLFGDGGLSPLTQSDDNNITEGGNTGNTHDNSFPDSCRRELRSPLVLSGLAETAQMALVRATKAEARSAALERELAEVRREQEQERDAFETRLAQLAGQVAFAVNWIHNFDPSRPDS